MKLRCSQLGHLVLYTLIGSDLLESEQATISTSESFKLEC